MGGMKEKRRNAFKNPHQRCLGFAGSVLGAEARYQNIMQR